MVELFAHILEEWTFIFATDSADSDVKITPNKQPVKRKKERIFTEVPLKKRKNEVSKSSVEEKLTNTWKYWVAN